MSKSQFTFDKFCDDLGPAKVVHTYDPCCDLRAVVVIDNVACGRMAAEARLGGVITGRGGTVLVHVGDGDGRLAPLRAALEASDLPCTSFYPTHVNRSRSLLNEAIAFADAGGFIDFTASTRPEFIADGEVPALEALRIAVDAGVPAARLTVTSDAGGSLPLYVDGDFKGLEAATPDCLLNLIFETARQTPDRLPQIIAAMTLNPATALRLSGVGRIAPSCDANLLLLDFRSGHVTDVMCRGHWLMRRGRINPMQSSVLRGQDNAQCDATV